MFHSFFILKQSLLKNCFILFLLLSKVCLTHCLFLFGSEKTDYLLKLARVNAVPEAKIKQVLTKAAAQREAYKLKGVSGGPSDLRELKRMIGEKLEIGQDRADKIFSFLLEKPKSYAKTKVCAIIFLFLQSPNMFVCFDSFVFGLCQELSNIAKQWMSRFEKERVLDLSREGDDSKPPGISDTFEYTKKHSTSNKNGRNFWECLLRICSLSVEQMKMLAEMCVGLCFPL